MPVGPTLVKCSLLCVLLQVFDSACFHARSSGDYSRCAVLSTGKPRDQDVTAGRDAEAFSPRALRPWLPHRKLLPPFTAARLRTARCYGGNGDTGVGPQKAAAGKKAHSQLRMCTREATPCRRGLLLLLVTNDAVGRSFTGGDQKKIIVAKEKLVGL
ncbi:hypothetical protein GUJ93_ZPchr0001g30893 [Zizania palustris]|uniref:Secreted protein n=1 Tax=Zizania palustris TaxID=103762 RepID=A0A8J5RRR3_ZIZPA|nr:hypothetical protein GUJ93_ZPchr0001g30893 [Zizania palustris]